MFVEPQILLSAGGALTRGVRGQIFENLGSQKPPFLHFETHFRQITNLFYSNFLSYNPGQNFPGQQRKIALSLNIFILHILSRSSTFLLSCLCNFWKAPSPQTMLSATGIIRTVDKLSIVTTLLRGGVAGEQFVINFANRPIIFGQDCLILALLLNCQIISF